MFISPKTAIEEGWIRHPDATTIDEWNNQKFISPNAIDFTLDRLFNISYTPFHISEEGKKMRGGEEITPIVPRAESSPNYWKLDADTVYDGMSNAYLNIPEGVAAMLIVRSTFNRNGIFITSGLWDSGYVGHVGFAIHNRSAEAYITPGTRVGQIIFVSSDNAGVYAGGWNHAEGTHHSE